MRDGGFVWIGPELEKFLRQNLGMPEPARVRSGEPERAARLKVALGAAAILLKHDCPAS